MEYETKTIQIGNRALKAIIADSMAKRARGLSGRERLNGKECMLFIFPHEATFPVWMRGMKFSIDIIWLDEKKHIIDFKSNLPPASGILDFKTYSHKKQAKYAIELPAGFIKNNKVKTSTRIVL